MKTLGIIIASLLLTISGINAQNLQPYILGAELTESLAVVSEKVVMQLEQNGIKVVGQYQPAADKNRWIIIFSSIELENAVQKVGGLTGFAATLRIAITSEKGKTVVSYTNPAYWGNAYFQKEFDKVASNYSTLSARIENVMKNLGYSLLKPYGSKSGLTTKDLRKYQYMFGMPYFEDNIELGSFGSHQAAISTIDANIAKGIPNVKMVYKITIPGKELTLYGFALGGEKGESKFLPTIDIAEPKHTAFLPYEMLVMNNKVLMLHGRFRIALSFPDLTMGTFTKIMSTPGDIENMLKQTVK